MDNSNYWHVHSVHLKLLRRNQNYLYLLFLPLKYPLPTAPICFLQDESQSIDLHFDPVSTPLIVAVEGAYFDNARRLTLLSHYLIRRSEEHTSELQSRPHLVCRLLLEKKNIVKYHISTMF